MLSLYAARPITPTDYVASRWSAFFTVAAVVAWLPEAVLFVWNLLDAQRHRRRGSATTGTSCRASSRPGSRVAVVLTTLALFVASFTTRRAYAAIGTLAVLFIGGAVGGIAPRQLRRHARGRALAGRPPAGRSIDTRALDLRRRRSTPTSAPGWVSALWLAGLTVVLAAWLLRRTERMVRG